MNGFLTVSATPSAHSPCQGSYHTKIGKGHFHIGFAAMMANLSTKDTLTISGSKLQVSNKAPDQLSLEVWLIAAARWVISVSIFWPGAASNARAFVSYVETLARQFGIARASRYEWQIRRLAHEGFVDTARVSNFGKVDAAYDACFAGVKPITCMICYGSEHFTSEHHRQKTGPAPSLADRMVRPEHRSTAEGDARQKSKPTPGTCNEFNTKKGCDLTADKCKFKHECARCPPGSKHAFHSSDCPKRNNRNNQGAQGGVAG